MKDIDLTGKCGSCYYFHLIEGTANGECYKFPYGDDVVHDAAHPFFQPGRSRIKCKNYRTTPITKADRIRSMSDEELAEFLLNRDLAVVGQASKAAGFTYKFDRESCLADVVGWLKQEVGE